MASTYLTRTSSSPTNALKWTYSFWVKISSLSTSDDTFLLDFNTDDNNRSNIGFNGSQQLVVYEKVSGSTSQLFTSNRLFRDSSAWMHIVVSCDRTLSTAGDRTKIYINNVQETSFASQTNPAQNTTGIINTAVSTLIGKYSQNTYYFDGCLTHVHFTDGYAYAASTFGETDSTSGIWKPKTAPSVTYGNNGFFLKFENSGAMGTDSSGNSNTFTVGGGTLTQNVDTPSNNFATMNSLDNYIASGTFANGNNTVTTVNTGYTYNTATMGVNKGKWYWECKWSAQPTGSTNQVLIGIAKRTSPSTTTWLGSVAYTYAYQGTGTVHNSDTTIATYTTMSVGDIIGVALDLDNNRLYFSKNGTWQGSSDPANGTNPISITAPDSTSGDSGFYFPAFGDGNNNLQETGQFNFGQGYFGTTAVASANADANGNGIMEYPVPSGFYTLNTKNIKEFG
jgi:hypothetical protein